MASGPKQDNIPNYGGGFHDNCDEDCDCSDDNEAELSVLV